MSICVYRTLWRKLFFEIYCFFIYGLHKDSLNSWIYIGLNWMNTGRIWTDAIVACFKILFCNYPRHDSRCLGRDSNRTPSEYMSAASSPESPCSDLKSADEYFVIFKLCIWPCHIWGGQSLKSHYRVFV
jgi:hypothetical protein